MVRLTVRKVGSPQGARFSRQFVETIEIAEGFMKRYKSALRALAKGVARRRHR